MEAGRVALSPTVAVVSGVSGSGKTTLATALAGRLGWAFCEGDALHPAGNVAKMAAGVPLTDDDRWPWLARVRAWIDGCLADGRSGVVTCSALRRVYRDVLRRPEVVFVLLDVPRAQLEQRVRQRHGHFMPASLLASQLDTLEPLGADERAVVVAGAQPIAAQLDAVAAALG